MVLEQLERSCAEWKEDLAALKTALATVRPLRAAETIAKYKQHLAHQKEGKAQRRWPEQLEQALLLAKGKPAASVRDSVQHQIDEAQGHTAGDAPDARQLQSLSDTGDDAAFLGGSAALRLPAEEQQQAHEDLAEGAQDTNARQQNVKQLQAQEARDEALSEDSVPLNKLRHNRQQQHTQGAAPGNAAPMEDSADLARECDEKHQQQVQRDTAEDIAAMEDSGGAPLTVPAALAMVGTLAGDLTPPPGTFGRAPAASAALPNGSAGLLKQPPEAPGRTRYPPGKGKTRPAFPGVTLPDHRTAVSR